jgi:hypothetical protein
LLSLVKKGTSSGSGSDIGFGYLLGVFSGGFKQNQTAST